MFLVIHINYVIVVVLELINKKWLCVRSSVLIMCFLVREILRSDLLYLSDWFKLGL